MDATFDGFSIREYTSKMRSIDVFKCWPFTSSTSNHQLTRDQLHSCLPPFTLNNNNPRSNQTKSQTQLKESSRTFDDGYFSDESSKSDDFAPPPSTLPPLPPSKIVNDDDEKLEMICPVCREFNAATLTAVNAHIDGCLAESVRVERRHMKMMNSKSKALKSKFKSPKKRSIAEIFKVENKDKDKNQEEEEERVTKLCPLDEDVEDEVSITVKKFRWLSQRLEALRSKRGSVESEKLFMEEEKLEMICPVCRDFNAATVTAVNAHIDSCLGKAVRDERRQTMKKIGFNFKSKPKAPKKRSIAEILTNVPPIEVNKSKTIEVEEDDEDEDDDKFSDYSGDEDYSSASDAAVTVVSIKKNKKKNNKKINMKKGTKKKMTKKTMKSKLGKHVDSGVLMNNEKKKIVNMKKKKKNKNIFNNGNKESAYKRAVQTTANNCRKLRGTIDSDMVALQDTEPSVHRKKLGFNGLSVEKKPQGMNCDSVGKRQKADSPVRGILKNHLKHVSGKVSDECKIQDVTEESHENNQVLTSDRHVKFSYKDEIVGSKERDSFDETRFNISSDSLASSYVKEQSSGSDEKSASFESSGNGDHIPLDNDKSEEVYPLSESKQFSNTLEQVTGPNFFKPCINIEKSSQLEQKSELLTKLAVNDKNNLEVFDGGNTDRVHFSPYADISRPLSAVQEGKMCGENTQVCESGIFSFGGKFIDYMEDPTFQVDAVNKNASTKTFLEPSSSYSAPYNKVDEKPESPSQTYGDNGNSGQDLGDKELCNMFPADMIDNKSYSFTSWGKGCIRNSCSDPNFFGLPLNSHGELINFSSSGNVGVNQMETSTPLEGSLSGLPIDNILCQSSQETLSINERHVIQKTIHKDVLNSFSHYPPRLGVTELGSQREDIHPPNSEMCSSHHVQPLLHSELLKRNSCVEQNQCGRVQNQPRNGLVNLKEGADHISQSSSQPTMRLMGKDVPIAKNSQETQQFTGDLWTDEESRRRHYAEYTALLGSCSKQDWVSGSPLQISTDSLLQSEKIQRTPELQSTHGFPQQLIDQKSNHVSKNGSLGVPRNASSYFNPNSRESTSYGVFNEESYDFSGPPGLSSRPRVLPTPCNFSQPTCSRNGELNGRNKNPHVTKSAFGFPFPFLQPAVNEQAKTYWFQGPYTSVPSWLSSSTEDMLTGTYSQRFSGVGNQNYPQNRWGNNFITPSVNHSAEHVYPSNPLTSRGPMKTTPIRPTAFVQPPQVLVAPSTMNGGSSNINKVVDRVKFDDTVVKDYHPYTNIRKRPAAVLDDSTKPIKLSNIEVKENLSHTTRLTGENSSVDLQRNKRAVVLDPQVEIARSRCCQNVAQQNQYPTSYPTVDSFKLDSTIRSSPVLLGPKRAKHILKPS